MEGFILTQDWRDRGGECRLIFAGTGQDGPFELRARARPVFFVPRRAQLPPAVTPAERRPLEMTDFAGKPVDALYFTTQREARSARDSLREKLIPVYESDVNPADRYLMEYFVHGSVSVSGDRRRDGNTWIYEDPRVQRGDFVPAPSTMSVDIETGRQGELYSIAYHFCRDEEEAGRVYVVSGSTDDDGIMHGKLNEADVIRAFLEDCHQLDPDILIGWNVISFDLHFLDRKCAEHEVAFALGRRGTVPRFREVNGALTVHVHGRVVVDGPPTLRGSFFRFEDFSLDAVAGEVLGESKDITGHGERKIEEIERRFREDKPALARYNLRDCRLVTDIFAKLGIIDLMVSRVRISGMLMDRLGRSVRAFDHFYLPRLHRKGVVAPNIDDVAGGRPAPGGLVFTSKPGLYDNVAVMDFKSLYPSVIRTFRIDPLSRLRAGADPVQTPAGVAFSRSEHILPDYIEELMEKRARAKQEGNGPLSQAIKILMNSFYGVMGTTGCRFYHPDLPLSITGTGQWLLRASKEHLEKSGYSVLYGDTDSLFVQLKEGEQEPHRAAMALADAVNLHLHEKIHAEFRVDSALDLEFEKLYRRFFLPPMRGSSEGSCKRYAGLVLAEDGEETLEFTGLEIVRSDWTPLAKRFQFELFRRFFADEELEGWMRDITCALREGRLDDQLTYRKRIRKAVAEYTKSNPPHVRAALMLPERDRKGLREVSYVMTQRGPVPISRPHDDLDYEHYVERQLKPIADTVLSCLGRSFDGVVGNEQLELF